MTDPTAPSYTAQALRTESPITPALQTRLQQQARLVHAVLGLQTEAGELADPIKKHIFYGRPVDAMNLREEIGDCLWYLAIACDALGTTLEAEQARNLAKLRARYPHVFTAAAAQVRDLDRERQVLEGADVEPTPVVKPAPCSECERLQEELDKANEHRTDLVLFVDKVRKSFRVWGGDQSFFDSVSHALDELDTNSSAILTSSAVKDSLTTHAEGGT